MEHEVGSSATELPGDRESSFQLGGRMPNDATKPRARGRPRWLSRFAAVNIICFTIRSYENSFPGGLCVCAFSSYQDKRPIIQGRTQSLFSDQITRLLGQYGDEEARPHLASRSSRAMFVQAVRKWIEFSSIAGILFSVNSNNRAGAACLSGDTSADCIGVYKVPIDDATLPYLGTPESAAKFAPDLRFVPPVKAPKSYPDAVVEFRSLQSSLEDVKQQITKGQLEAGGKVLLFIIPRATVSSRVILRVLDETREGSTKPSLKLEGVSALRLESFLSDIVPKLNQCDIMIGQALRGELGSITFAQIQILEVLNELSSDYNEVIKALEMLT